METVLQDLRFGARMLRKTPGFTAVAVLALALGIGGTTAIFSVVNAVLLRPLPFPDPDRLVVFHRVGPQGHKTAPHSYPDFADFRDQSRTFAGMAAIRHDQLTLTGGGEPENLMGAAVSLDFFDVLGVEPARGRAFLPGEDARGRGAVAVLSHGLWVRRFGADPGILGRTIVIDGVSREVVGVMSREFRFVGPVEVWIPLEPPADPVAARNMHSLLVIGRLRSDVAPARARAELETISREIGRLNDKPRWGVNPVPLLEDVAGPVRPLLFLLLGAVALVLLIGCANVANLLLARAAARQREMAIRLALGAGGGRVVRQVLTESALLALLGGAAGVALAFWGIEALVRLLPENFPRLQGIHLDLPVLAFTLAVSLATGLLFGLAPALQARSDSTEALKEGGSRLSAGLGHRRLRSALLVGEVALALVLLVGATLLLRSFARLMAIEPGFRPDNVLLVELPRPAGPEVAGRGEPSGDLRRNVAFYREVLERVAGLPGVRSAGGALSVPLGNVGAFLTFEVEGQPEGGRDEPLVARVNPISPGYFGAMGIQLLRGRGISAADHEGAPQVAVVNEAFARRIWPGKDALGKRINLGEPESGDPWVTVVGVARDVRTTGLHVEPGPELYLSYPQSPDFFMTVAIRTVGSPGALAAAVRREVQSVDPNQPVGEMRTMEELIADSVASPRARLLLLGSFAAMALLLAAVGIYGVISYTVAQRTHEIGIRMALGARRDEVLRFVVGQGMRLALAGVAAGLTAALLTLKLLAGVLHGPARSGPLGFGDEGPSGLLFEVGVFDPPTLVAAMLMLGLVALLASWLPARRAAAVDPLVALRAE